MKYKVEKDIIIYSTEDFNPEHILECGQVFSYEKIDDNYIVYSADKKAVIKREENCYRIVTDDAKYFINYFDLNTNYSQVKNNIKSNHLFMEKAINFGSGIRILKQDPFETIISFIVSANNNIKRIQKILFAIREKFGVKQEKYYAFPTLEQLKIASEEDFKKIGAGYRAKYLYSVCRQLEKEDLSMWAELPTNQLNLKLLSLMGVGQKVADCIMLFGFSRQDVFPVDTWIEKVYCRYFNEEHDRKKIRQNLLATFGKNSGYAQQYLFYSQRSDIK